MQLTRFSECAESRTVCPFFKTKTNECGLSWLNVCGRNIPMNPMTVARRMVCVLLLSGEVKLLVSKYRGSRNAHRLSAWKGSVLSIPLPICLKNGVVYLRWMAPLFPKVIFYVRFIVFDGRGLVDRRFKD